MLNVGINTTIQQYDIAMRFEGPIDKMRTNYTSDPALPPAGHHQFCLRQNERSLSCEPQPAGKSRCRIGRRFGGEWPGHGPYREDRRDIASIRDPTLGGNQQNPGATVTIQQRVTGKIFVTFSTDVTATQRQVIQLEYQKSPRVSFSGTRDQNGGFALDTKIHKSW